MLKKFILVLGLLFSCFAFSDISLNASAEYQDGDFSPYTPEQLYNIADQRLYSYYSEHIGSKWFICIWNITSSSYRCRVWGTKELDTYTFTGNITSSNRASSSQGCCRVTFDVNKSNGDTSSFDVSRTSNDGASTYYLDNDDIQHIYSVGCNVVWGNGSVEPVDTSPPAPFTVSVSPDLYMNMSGSTISYPSKSGGTVTDTLYPIKLDVTLTDEFIERFGNSLIYDDGYSFTCFVVPTDYVSEDIDSMCAHSIYNYTYYGKFTNDSYENTFNVNSGNSSLLHPADGSLTASPDTSQFWHVGEGWTNIASVSCSSPSRSVSLDATSIDFANHPATSYNIVIHACKAPTDLRFVGVPSTWYYNNVSEHHFKQTGTIVSTEGEETEYYLQYTWVSDAFKYSSDPAYFPSTYEAELNANGQTAQTDPFAFSRSPSVVWDDALMYATDSNGNTNGTSVKGYTIDEWNKVLQERQWTSNFNSNYDVGNVTDVLNGSSSFFGFLTASIAVLPSWFMTILTSFFVTLLAIAVIKFLI